jgi:hypothetical protein
MNFIKDVTVSTLKPIARNAKPAAILLEAADESVGGVNPASCQKARTRNVLVQGKHAVAFELHRTLAALEAVIGKT